MKNQNLSNIDQLPESGWGLKILFPIADELTYTRTPDGRQNCLKLVKNYGSSPSQSGDVQPEDPSNNSHNSPAKLKTIKLRIDSDLAQLENVLAWYQQLENQPIPKPIWWPCQIALAEGFTNAVNHAHKDLPCTTPIDLQVTVFNEFLEIFIWDFGPPFDLQAEFNSLVQN